jgi:hypothetical protein
LNWPVDGQLANGLAPEIWESRSIAGSPDGLADGLGEGLIEAATDGDGLADWADGVALPAVTEGA